ncbi:MAG: hypothetical protein ACT4QD_09205 [Acidobacteriota bacterium]
MRFGLLALAVLALTTAPARLQATAAADISGDWMLMFNGPMGPIEAGAKLTQDGEDVKGTLEGPQGTIEVTGTVKGTKLALSINVDAGGQMMTVYIVGEVEGDAMTGTFSFEGGAGDWSGKRKK